MHKQYPDDDCENAEYCDIPVGAIGGNCELVTGECGYADNHAWQQYECGDEPGCPTCPSGSLCENRMCVERALDCPDFGFLGTEQTCHATEGDDSCIYCYVRVTHPDGTIILGNTDGYVQYRPHG